MKRNLFYLAALSLIALIGWTQSEPLQNQKMSEPSQEQSEEIFSVQYPYTDRTRLPLPEVRPAPESASEPSPEEVAVLSPDQVPETTLASEERSLVCEKLAFFRINQTQVWKMRGQDAFFYESGMTIDADGAPNAYHPEDIGTDCLSHAGAPGNWRAVVTDKKGNPVVQGPDDPMPGYYISTTSLQDKTKSVTEPCRYVNSEEIPYTVLPLGKRGVARLGDFVTVVNRKNNRVAHAIFADHGPNHRIGEGSIALARALGINPDPRYGGTQGNVVYILFPNSGNGRPRSIEDINSESEKLFAQWGSMERLESCFPPQGE